jgi:two-component system sensor histidine kinase KdpD
MTRLGSGALAAHNDWVDVREIFERARARVGDPLRGHRVEVNVAEEARKIYADAVLLEQVIVNVLDNAAKFSPAGSRIELNAAALADEVIISVADEGPGIPAAERERVFDMFYRVRDRDESTQGSGLGLAICKGFVEVMGGRIAVRAGREGRGTQIEITLPRHEPPAGRLTEAA